MAGFFNEPEEVRRVIEERMGEKKVAEAKYGNYEKQTI